MDWIIPRFGDADVVYFGTPIYNYNIIHYLQRMTERMLPTALPYMVEKDGTTRHPERYERKPQKLVLAAVAGFPDTENFNQAKALFPNSLYIFLPSAQLIQSPEGSKYLSEFKNAVKEAGRQIVTGDVSEEVKSRLEVKLPPEVKQMIREQANKYFEGQIKRE
jgi:multimeric flavodoxin WrbA